MNVPSGQTPVQPCLLLPLLSVLFNLGGPVVNSTMRQPVLLEQTVCKKVFACCVDPTSIG